MPRSENPIRMKLAVFGTAFTLTLGACSDIYYDRRDTINLSAGDANASNIAVQTIDPWPRHAANRNIQHNGEVIQSAIKRYREGKVTPPRGLGTSSIELTPAPQAPAVSQ